LGDRVIVYFCKIQEASQPISRHHIASVAACHVLRELDLSVLHNILSDEEYSTLIREGELIITEPERIQRITCVSPSEEIYLRLKIK